MTTERLSALIFDFDGTLVDSDQALIDPFVTLGVRLEDISFGHAIREETDRLGLSLDAYVEAYDDQLVQPFPGVDEVVGQLDRWAICSNKHPVSAAAEVARLGWNPRVAAADPDGIVLQRPEELLDLYA